MQRRIKLGLAGVALVALLAGCAAPSESTEPDGNGEPIAIGAGFPLSGQLSFVGEEMRAAVEAVVSDINEAGGVNGSQINLIIEDTTGDPTTAANVTQKLITSDGVQGLVGFYGTAESIAASNVAEQYGVPIVLPLAAGRDTVTRGFTHLASLFPTVNPDASPPQFPASEALPFLAKATKAKTASILYVDQVPFSEGAPAWRAQLEGLGVEVVNYEALDPAGTSYAASVTKAAQNPTDLVLTVGYGPQMALLFKELKQFDVQATGMYVDSIAATEPPFIEAVGLVDGLTFTPIWFEDSPYEEANAFAKRLADEGVTATVNAILSAAATQVLLGSFEEAGSTDGDAVAEALHGTHKTLLGELTFDETGLSDLHPLFVQIQGGKFVTIAPDEYANGEFQEWSGWN